MILNSPTTHYLSNVWDQYIFYKEINTFIQQGCIQLSKDIYIVPKDLYFK